MNHINESNHDYAYKVHKQGVLSLKSSPETVISKKDLFFIHIYAMLQGRHPRQFPPD